MSVSNQWVDEDLYIRVVVGNLAGNMVKDMSLWDTMGSVGANPAHDTAKIAENVTVERSKSTTGKCELWGTVMGKDRICVLKEGNQDEPVVYPRVKFELVGCVRMQIEDAPEIRDDINSENLPNTKTRSHRRNYSEPEDDTSIGPNNLPVLMGFEHDSIRIKI